MKIELEVRVGRRAPETVRLDRPSVMIGRSESCDLIIDSSERDAAHVAEQHAKIEVIDGSAKLVDLESAKGTWLNKRSVQEATTIHKGNSFSLGRLGPVIRVRELELPAPRKPRNRVADIGVALVLIVVVGIGIQVLFSEPEPVNPGSRPDTVSDPPITSPPGPGQNPVPPGPIPAGRPLPAMPEEPPEVKLARQAHGILQSSCFSCHGESPFDSDMTPSLATVAAMTEAGVLEPNDPESRVVGAIHDESMPKMLGPTSDDEKQLVRRWIEAGAPDFNESDAIEDEARRELAMAAGEFFTERCLVCHHDHSDVPSSFTTLAGMTEEHLVPGDPDGSSIWQRIRDDEMPPAAEPVAEADLEVLEEWIAMGAPEFPGPPELPEMDLETITDHGMELVDRYCRECHIDNSSGGFVMTQTSEVMKKVKDPTDPESSLLWKAVAAGRMPKKDAGGPMPTETEKQLLLEWIRAGAPMRTREVEFFSFDEMLTLIHNDLQQVPVRERYDTRYFTLASFYNEPSISEEELRFARAALSKLLNSLSWEPEIRLPQSVDGRGIVYRIRLSDYGWTRRAWSILLEEYPYGIDYTLDRRSAVRDTARQIASMSGTKLSFLRADWFIDFAPRSELYNQLLTVPDPDDRFASGMPREVSELERRLGVDPQADFVYNRLVRAGFAESGVSGFNRLLDRHALPDGRGYYWKSYDFLQSSGTGDLFRRPLGPLFPSARGFSHEQLSQYADVAFEQDGGEMIFSLPNGLQGYYLTDAVGISIPAGPIEVVRDAQAATGTGQVVNAISCMGCHQHGMIRIPNNSVLDDADVSGEQLIKVQQLYRPVEEFNQITTADQERFLEACGQAILPFLLTTADEGKTALDFNDPIVPTAKLHQRDVTVAKAAADLGLSDAEKLGAMIGRSQSLSRLMGPLSKGNAIDRARWISTSDGTSDFQKAVKELRLGEPLTDFEQDQTYSW